MKKRIPFIIAAALLLIAAAIGIAAAVSGGGVEGILDLIVDQSYDRHVDLNKDGEVDVLDAIAEMRNNVGNHLIRNADGSYGGTLNESKYGKGAPLNGEYDVKDSDYYVVNNNFYNMPSTSERTVVPRFASYQQTMSDSSGIACLMMILNHMGKDVRNEYTELALVQKYEELTGTKVKGNGTTEEGLIQLVNSLDLGYTAAHEGITISMNDTRANQQTKTKTFLTESLQAGKFVLVRYQSPVGYGWKVVIGYDTQGDVRYTTTGEYTDHFGDDVIIFAEPNDGFDHCQDGYATERAQDFLVWWRRMTVTGLIKDTFSYLVIDTGFEPEHYVQPLDETVKQELYDIHLPLNPDGTYGGTRNADKYGTIVSGNGWWNHTDSNYYKINDFYNMGSEGSRILLPHYTVLEQTMGSSCGVCAINSVMKYYGDAEDVSYYDLELIYTEDYERITGSPVKGGTNIDNHEMVLTEYGYPVVEKSSIHKGSYPKYRTYAQYVGFIKENLLLGRPVVISTNMGSGHYLTIIGYDDMGTDYIYDDVIIMADSSDYWDGYQDGYDVHSAYKVFAQHTNSQYVTLQAIIVFDKKSESGAMSVSDVLEGRAGSREVTVEGLFAGVADEGAGYDKMMLLKDTENDSLIAVKGVKYGSFPDYGYDKGDLVRIKASAVKRTYESDGENRTYLVFADNNPEKAEDTVVSRGNEMTYDLSKAAVIDSWTAMKNFFKADAIEQYSLVRFTGDMYFNSYGSNSDSIPLHRFHMNKSASNLAGMKPDGTRALGLRQNMLEANVPSAVTTYFDPVIGTATYPGVKGNYDFYAVVTSVNGVNFQLTILESDWLVGNERTFETETNQEIAIQVAYSYLYKRDKITYDQRYRCEDMSPEDASWQQRMYLDCSSYVDAVYYEAFGYHVLGVPITEKGAFTSNFAAFAKENAGKRADVIGYWEPNTYTTDAQRQAALNEIISLLQPGDLINYRHGRTSDASGHVMMYIGNDTVIHSTGRTTEYDATDPENKHGDRAYLDELVWGTVRLMSTSELFTNKSSSRYLMKNDSSDVMRSVAIIRPLANGLTPTEKTLNRMKIAGLSLEKTVSPGVSASVCPGGEISYVISIDNHSSYTYTNVLFEDVLSEYLTFVSGNTEYTTEGQKISKTFDIGPFGSVKFRYTCKVSEEAPAGARIESNGTKVGGVDVFNTVNVVGKYGEDDLDLIASKALEYAQNGSAFADPVAFAKAIYKETVGDDILAFDSSAALFDEAFVPYGTSSFTLNTESPLADSVVPRMYSGTLVPRPDDIIAVYYEHNFMKGDLIFCNTGSKYVVYVYVGDGKLVRVSTANTSAETVENGNEVFNSSLIMKTILSAVRTYEKCVVIRPSVIPQ